MMNDVCFELGERRKLTMKVWCKDPVPFTVMNCSWSLSNSHGEESTGDCDVEFFDGEYHLTAEIEPQKKGMYRLQFIFYVGSERIKRSVGIEVV